MDFKLTNKFINMSEQAGGLLETNQSFHYDRNKVKGYCQNNIDSNKFFAWEKDNMYKSTYNNFHSHNSNQPKNTAIPGYQGFVPGHRADSMYAKSNTLIAKQSFSKDKLDINRTGLSTTGFNITKEAFLDKSQNAFSSKYGKTALQKAHPNWSETWKTTNQITYVDPKNVHDPLFRETGKFVQGDKLKNKESGFGQNSSFWDGTGWKPHPILNPNNIGTQYRNRFNPQKDFHRKVNVSKERKKKPTEKNYPYNF